MAVAEISGYKLIVRMTDADSLGVDAKRFMNGRLRPRHNDGSIWMIPQGDDEQWETDKATLKSFGFEFFDALYHPHAERPWAKRVFVKYLNSDPPEAQILWINPNEPNPEFNGRPFEVCTNKEFYKIAALRHTEAVEYTPATSDIVTQAFIEHCCYAYKMDHDGYHGFYHWMRVLQNGRHLAKAENANIKVVELFALLHDTQRQNEDDDPEHGLRAAQFAQTLRGTWFYVTDAEMELLTEALIHHSEGYTEGDVTVRVCWDADRLDLGRVGINPKPDRLCTETARNDDVLFWANARSRHKVV